MCADFFSLYNDGVAEHEHKHEHDSESVRYNLLVCLCVVACVYVNEFVCFSGAECACVDD